MATVFLIGGTGNHLFQFTRAQSSDKFSYAFLKGPIHTALGWTKHGRLFDFPKAGWIDLFMGLAALLIDLPLAKLTGKSLFTSIDLRAVKGKPILARLAQIGYFQNESATRPIDDLRPQIEVWRKRSIAPQIAVHIRGGDILTYQEKGENPYGILPIEYHKSAFERAGVGRKTVVFTDDRARARQILEHFAPAVLDYEIDDGSLDDMIAGCTSADTFIACNSTLSYWILQLRGPDQHSIAPSPFTATLGIDLPQHIDGVPVTYR